jgi:hypothetical protein
VGASDAGDFERRRAERAGQLDLVAAEPDDDDVVAVVVEFVEQISGLPAVVASTVGSSFSTKNTNWG